MGMWKKQSLRESVETKGVREDVQTKDTGLGVAETDGTTVTYATGFLLSGGYQSVTVRCEVALPTTVSGIKKTQRRAVEIAEEHLAGRLPESQKLLKQLIKLSKSMGG